jgi:hypothetical protein
MKKKSSAHVLQAAVIIALAINLFIAIRSGWQIGLNAAYAFWGTPAEAVVNNVSRYFTTVREPKPTRYSAQFRGQYIYEIKIDSGEPVRVMGRFDTVDFTGSSNQEVLPGDRMLIKYLSFDPNRSKPEMALGPGKLTIAACFFAASSFLSAMFLFILFKMPLFLEPNVSADRYEPPA